MGIKFVMFLHVRYGKKFSAAILHNFSRHCGYYFILECLVLVSVKQTGGAFILLNTELRTTICLLQNYIFHDIIYLCLFIHFYYRLYFICIMCPINKRTNCMVSYIEYVHLQFFSEFKLHNDSTFNL